MNDQIVNVINKAKSVLIATHSRHTVDSAASVTVLAKGLRDGLGKDVTIVMDKPIPEYISKVFAKSDLKIIHEVQPTNYVISLDNKDDKIKNVKWDEEEGVVNFYITTKKGKFDFDKVSFGTRGGGYDLVIFVDCAKAQWLGNIWRNSQEFLSEVSSINIDSHSVNESFGKENVVDSEASSTSQIVFEFLNSLKINLSKEDVTALFTGVVSNTDSFRREMKTPKTFQVASQMIEKGAQVSKAVSTLYQSLDISQIHYLGKIMQNLATDEKSGAIYSTVRLSDLKETAGQTPRNVDPSGLIFNRSSDYRIAFLLVEFAQGKVRCEMESNSKDVDAAKLAKVFGGGGTAKKAGFTKDGNVEGIKSQLLQRITELFGAQEGKEEKPSGQEEKPEEGAPPEKQKAEPEEKPQVQAQKQVSPQQVISPPPQQPQKKNKKKKKQVREKDEKSPLKPAEELPPIEQPSQEQQPSPYGGYQPPPPMTPLSPPTNSFGGTGMM